MNMKKLIFDERPYKSFFEEREYKKEETPTPSVRRPELLEYREPERPREITIERRTIHKMLKEEELEPLRKVSPKVIGNLFDRVEFSRQRISEIRTALETRKILHKELMDEIDADIGDKQRMVSGLSNIDDVRDFKLDISTLRMEKRRENVLFWRDVLDLTTQLRELTEEYETEAKVANLFKDLQPGV